MVAVRLWGRTRRRIGVLRGWRSRAGSLRVVRLTRRQVTPLLAAAAIGLAACGGTDAVEDAGRAADDARRKAEQAVRDAEKATGSGREAAREAEQRARREARKARERLERAKEGVGY